VKNVELIPVLHYLIQTLQHQAKDWPESIQLFVPQKVVVSWPSPLRPDRIPRQRMRMGVSSLADIGVGRLVPFCCF
jgi:hypothetical protein